MPTGPARLAHFRKLRLEELEDRRLLASVGVIGANLEISDTSGITDDTLTISRSGSNIRVRDPNHTLTAGAFATQVDANTVDVPLGAINGAIQVSTLDGSDTLTVDFSGGNPITFLGIVYNGAAGGTDTLTVTGGATTSVTHTLTNASDGSVTLAGALAGTIMYTGLEPVTDNLSAADRIFTFNGGSETITLVDAAGPSTTIDSTLGESVTFANPITSLTINAGTGDDIVTITSVDAAYNATLTINGGTGNDTVNLDADITFAANRNLDVDLQNDAATPGIDTINVGAGANLIFSGTGTATLKTSRNIVLASGSSIAIASGGITIEANQQSTATAGNFIGVDLNNATISGGSSGLIAIKGRGGNDPGGSQYGVRIWAGAGVGPGTRPDVQGIGGNSTGPDNHGVLITDLNSRITSSGAITVIGIGGGTGASSNNRGVSVVAQGRITSGGATLTVTGQGGNLAGSGNFNDGVVVQLGQITGGTSGLADITGIHGGGSSSVGINLADNALINTTSNGNIRFTADRINIEATASVNATTNTATFVQRTNNRAINLGGVDSSVLLGLTDAELDRVTAGTLVLGSTSSGTVTISEPISRVAATVITVNSAAAINFTTGSLDSAGANVTLNPGSRVSPAATGTEIIMGAGTLAFGTDDDLAITINGTTVDTQYQQLNVAGRVNLTGLNLLISGSHTPALGQTFVIVANDGVDAVIGRFNGPAHIDNFMGSIFQRGDQLRRWGRQRRGAHRGRHDACGSLGREPVHQRRSRTDFQRHVDDQPQWRQHPRH